MVHRPCRAAPTADSRVAEYLRMSTERQEYSPVNQATAIQAYAAAHGMTVVRTYRDEGRSGLRLQGRAGLQQLIGDIERGSPGFDAVLVLDVSRWGRFQNADEAAFYEYLCLRHGVRVIYIAEPFEADGTPLSAVLKGLKRSMAAEYSRELSAKVFAGQCHVVRAGFHMGGPPGYGLRRMLVDAQGRPKGLLAPREQKALVTDHVKLVPGPAEEVRVVRWLFQQSAAGVDSNAIVRRLNAKGTLNQHGRPWSLSGMRQLLDDERYIGTSVFARTTQAIGHPRGACTPEREVRVAHAFEALVPDALFWRAKAVREARARKLTDAEMLEAMRGVWRQYGRVTSRLLDHDPVAPTAQSYLRRFGTLRAAYRQIGYHQDRGITYGDTRERIRPWRLSILHLLMEQLRDAGSSVERDDWILRIDGVWTLRVRLLQAGSYRGSYRWEVRPGRRSVDIVVAARMAEDGSAPLDYLILPRVQADRWPAWVHRRPSAAVRFYTHPSLAIVTELARISRPGDRHEGP